MPCHSDRVRRNYHKIILGSNNDHANNEQIISIRITKLQIATKMSKTEVVREIFRSVRNGIFEYYVAPEK